MNRLNRLGPPRLARPSGACPRGARQVRAVLGVLSLVVAPWLGASARVLSAPQEGEVPQQGAAPQEAPKTEGGTPPAPAAKLPPGVYARVNGRDVTEREYAEYLLASIGRSHLDRYIDRLLVETAARAQGIAVTPEEIEKLVDERIQRTVEGIYRGNREAFLARLERQHTTIEERRAQERQEIYYDQLLERVLLKNRQVDDDAIRKEFERVYGPGGVQFELRHIVVATSKAIGATGEQLPPRAESEALERANKVHQELLGGADFVDLVKRYSDDPLTRQNDGRIPVYRRGTVSDDFDAAVEKLTRESPLSGVVRSKRGFHLIQLIDRRVTKLDDVRGEVENHVRNRPPTREEKQEGLKKLREVARIER